jgi:hypothetical protein
MPQDGQKKISEKKEIKREAQIDAFVGAAAPFFRLGERISPRPYL